VTLRFLKALFKLGWEEGDLEDITAAGEFVKKGVFRGF